MSRSEAGLTREAEIPLEFESPDLLAVVRFRDDGARHINHPQGFSDSLRADGTNRRVSPSRQVLFQIGPTGWCQDNDRTLRDAGSHL